VSARGRPRPVLGAVAAAGAGACLAAAFPPLALWPLSFVALVPLLWALRGAGAIRGALLGAAFGLAFFGATLSWILRFGELAFGSLTLVSALFLALFGAVAPALMRPRRPLVTALGIASWWVAVEALRGAWPLGGFTWGTLGIPHVDDPVLLRLASVTGVWGISFVVAAVNALVAAAVLGGGGAARAVARLGLAAALVLAPVGIPFPRATGAPIRVATLQLDVRTAAHEDPRAEDLAIARGHVELHRMAATTRPDLIVWGEGALDPAATADPATMRAVRAAIGAGGVPTLVGAVVRDRGERTSVLAFGPSGEPLGRYDKVHLVPFGEYVPFRERLRFIQAIEQVPVDRVPGRRSDPLHVPGLAPIGTPICFENAFPALPRAVVRAGAELLVVPVNNASYGFSAAAEQHLQMSRMRAVEVGRWVVNAGISGVSALIDPAGRVRARTELFETTILAGTVRSSTARTPYVRLGDLVPWTSAIIAVALFLAPRRRVAAARTPAPDPLGERPRILVIIPTFCERDTIVDVVRGALARPDDVTVLVVDDASPDGTAALVRDLALVEPRVRLLERAGKGGLATAYLEGFRLATAEGFDLVVEMDGDRSHDPEELDRLLAAARDHDLVIGSRYVPGGSVTNWSRLRLALSRGGNLYARLMLDLPIHDATSGYRVYRRQLLERLLERPIASEGYGFQIELALRAHRAGAAIAEVPITFREREHGTSKISRRIVAEALWLITLWGLRERFDHRDPTPASSS
jgi:apolipoprotein N-acyltransferase